jgi:hypothetical protein
MRSHYVVLPDRVKHEAKVCPRPTATPSLGLARPHNHPLLHGDPQERITNRVVGALAARFAAGVYSRSLASQGRLAQGVQNGLGAFPAAE